MESGRPVRRMWHLYKMGGLTPAIASMFGSQNAQQMAFIRSMMKEQRQHELYDIRLEQMEAVVFDLETTGFSPYRGDEIISIGAVAMSGGEVQEKETFYTVVNPRRPIPEEVEQLTGISTGMAQQAPELIQSLHHFLEFVGKRVLIVHGSGHDKSFMNSALWRTSKVNLSHRMLDCMAVARWLHPKREQYGLDSLLDSYAVGVTRRHHALDDAVMTARLWEKMLGDIYTREVSNLGELYSQLSKQQA